MNKFVFKHQVRGESWTFRALSGDAYKKLHGSDSRATTIIEKKRVDFSGATRVTRKTVLHELLHVYISTLHLSNSNPPDMDSFEEALVEMLENNWTGINKTTTAIFQKLEKQWKKNKENKNEQRLSEGA